MKLRKSHRNTRANTMLDAVCASLLITTEIGAILFWIAYLVSSPGWRLWAYGGACALSAIFFVWFIRWSQAEAIEGPGQ